ncbi:zinc finger MYM-type protein 3 isoform X1 [Hylaeus volcanicus]|uniref:zinc finger MYM-type protein 3 isoform X1 n=1 Tax=Hylaeus volcanicus TaxID=313075 RepID=UPI0023B7EDE6|nr:zinc finger MYM-type protein 3 isoform X1 [Hylaeus volcanicus]XP_053974676.1 zinc finger MYM-type protein 3 isoform X1 [Hylaeus volcanicus]XP_053974677.1 zinc finger MYM-type protein 3 isoform X1 [Hylaeus volcanicus]
MSMDPKIDLDLSTDKTEHESHTEDEEKAENLINQSKEINDSTGEMLQDSSTLTTDKLIADKCPMSEKVIDTVNEVEQALTDENLKSIEASNTEPSEENILEERDSQSSKQTLQETNENVTSTDSNDVQSEGLCEIVTKTVLQKDNLETASTVSNIADKDDTADLLNSVNMLDCMESQKSSKDVPEHIEIQSSKNISLDDTSNLSLTEKEDNVSDTQPDKVQLPIDEKDNSNSKKSDSEGILEDCDKDMSEKNVVEPENTEFVQFSQEKHGDDAQIENQSIDAEDPFGGDTLNAENVEPMDTDDPNETDVGFSKLCSQADNLQDIVNARENSFSSSNNKDNKENKDISVNTIESSNAIQNVDKNHSESSAEIAGSENLNKTEVAGSTEKCNDSIGKTLDEITPLETEEQSNVLPGQDDELCIIPDSMKVIIPGQTDKSKSNNNKSLPESSREHNKDVENCPDNELNISTNNDPQKSAKELKIEDENKSKDVENVQKEKDSTNNLAPTTEDVINIDEESKHSEIEEITTKEICKQCNEEKSCKIKVKIGFDTFNVCSKTCKALFKAANNRAVDIPSDGVNSKREKRCANCLLIVELGDERNLSWETMEFCNEECLGKFQTKYGSYCRNCNGSVQAVSLGKYCVRFGYDVRQFCCSTCLEEFKKGLKVCTYCQKDISSSTEGFLAPVGDKGQFKDFCTQDCMEKYSKMSSAEPPTMEKKCCSVCQEENVVHCEVQVDRFGPVAICSEPCFAAFKFVKKVDPDQCSTCKKFFELPHKKNSVVFYENEAHTFCSKTCLNIFIITNRKIVPCNWCKVKKYNFDMIKKELKTGQVMMMCSLNCLTLYQVSINAVSAKRINCDFCREFSQAQYHLTMSDATIRNFCSYNCVMNFQAQYTKSPITIPAGDDPVPTGMPKRTLPAHHRTTNSNNQKASDMQNKKTMPVISSVTSLAAMGNGQSSPTTQQNSVNNMVIPSVAINQSQTPQVIYKQHIITKPPSPIQIHNKTTQCKPAMHTKGVSVRPHPCTKATQTDEVKQAIVPIPVPIYVPYPMHMYSMPFPVPLPFPLPIPVPIFIPTTRNSAKGIFKDIKRIQEKIPADPFEAELLMMAEMVATEKKPNESDSDSADDRDEDAGDRDHTHSGGFSPEGVDSSNTFGDDMLQMALKMATGELDEPAVDLEAALTPNTITATQTASQSDTSMENDVQSERLIVASRGRKRMVPYKPRTTPSKRGRRVSATNDMPLMPPPEPQPPPQPRIIEPIEKPDANMALKYTFGVNAWRQWVAAKNAELEKQNTSMRKIKLFKTDLLQLTADELNYSLCLFVKEVRKPNGTEYAPDTIYYLCLGIQQYLFENNRIDNIFTDTYYEKFTDCLNEVAKKFSVLYNDAQYIVTRVEEEHLWECKQLGAHSPHVLLSTLMFFNTKHFNLVTVEEHMQLSFSHIMKHWKRNPAAQPTATTGKVPGSRNVLLRFYPPQSALEGNSRKKKVYEQQENEENPLRCPVKLYEFYLSKCPESVKTRNDVFYLLPERSCVPDSPVWYSTSPLAKEHLIKMLYRIKMVKEINVALLTS